MFVTDTNRFAGLVVLFAASLTAAQFLASKVVAVPLPTDAPIVGGAIIFPAGFVAYAFTYFATDCINELYGPGVARRVVVYGFAGLIGLFGMAHTAIALPNSGAGVGQGPFTAVVGSSANVMAGGLAAYAVSQSADVVLFDRLRIRTGGSHLWLRNIASTSVSQAVDTVVFIGLAFAVVPVLTGVGVALPPPVVVSLIVGQYVVKAAVAVFDTPFVYVVSRR